MNNGGGNSTGCFETEIRTNFMNIICWITYRMSELQIKANQDKTVEVDKNESGS